MLSNILIYGSLLSNEVNHEVLKKVGAKLITDVQTVEHIYSMYDDGDSPFLVVDNRGGGQVFGQLYLVNDEGLQIIDAFESDECNRIEVRVIDSVGKQYQAWIYMPFGKRYQSLSRLKVADWHRRKLL